VTAITATGWGALAMTASARGRPGQHHHRHNDDCQAQRLAKQRQRPARGPLPEHQHAEDHPGQRVGHAQGGQRRSQRRMGAGALVDGESPGPSTASVHNGHPATAVAGSRSAA